MAEYGASKRTRSSCVSVVLAQRALSAWRCVVVVDGRFRPCGCLWWSHGDVVAWRRPAATWFFTWRALGWVPFALYPLRFLPGPNSFRLPRPSSRREACWWSMIGNAGAEFAFALLGQRVLVALLGSGAACLVVRSVSSPCWCCCRLILFCWRCADMSSDLMCWLRIDIHCGLSVTLVSNVLLTERHLRRWGALAALGAVHATRSYLGRRVAAATAAGRCYASSSWHCLGWR